MQTWEEAYDEWLYNDAAGVEQKPWNEIWADVEKRNKIIMEEEEQSNRQLMEEEEQSNRQHSEEVAAKMTYLLNFIAAKGVLGVYGISPMGEMMLVHPMDPGNVTHIAGLLLDTEGEDDMIFHRVIFEQVNPGSDAVKRAIQNMDIAMKARVFAILLQGVFEYCMFVAEPDYSNYGSNVHYPRVLRERKDRFVPEHWLYCMKTLDDDHIVTTNRMNEAVVEYEHPSGKSRFEWIIQDIVDQLKTYSENNTVSGMWLFVQDIANGKVQTMYEALLEVQAELSLIDDEVDSLDAFNEATTVFRLLVYLVLFASR